jgi:hypothetical protein
MVTPMSSSARSTIQTHETSLGASQFRWGVDATFCRLLSLASQRIA